MEAFIEIQGWESAMGKVARLLPAVWMEAAMTEAVAIVKKKVQEYPPLSEGHPRWTSERQHRWYRWARKAQGLPLAYSRGSDPWSKQLKDHWQSKVSKGGQEGEVRNQTPYGLYVMGEAQQGFHRSTGWKTIEQIARDIAPDVNRAFVKAMKMSL